MNMIENYYSSIEVKSAGTKGRGVFATSVIADGSIIEIAPYIKVSPKDYKTASDTIFGKYWYEVRGDTCAIGLGYTSLYNHSEDCNAIFSLNAKDSTIKIVACKTILIGEEISIDYGYTP